MQYDWLESTPSVSGDYRNALPVWSPDMSFLQSMDMRINQQFDQGLQKIAGAYSLFHQPTTGAEAAKTQQDMAKQAQEQMKAVSAADISDPKNVMKAENILAPFWENTYLLTNISKTKQISANLQKAYSVRDSTDEKVRDQYDDRYVELLQYQRNNLAQAPLSENANVEVNDWIPFHKVGNHLDSFKEADKFGVTQSFVTGDGRIVTTTNGATSLPAFRTYADSKLGSEYDAQYNLLGKLSKERQVSRLMQTGLDRKSAQSEVGAQIIPGVMQSLQDRSKEYTDLIGINKAQLDKIMTEVNRMPGKTPTATQQYNIDRLTKEMEQYNSRQGEIDKQYKSLKDEGGQSIVSNPEYWLGQGYRNDDVNKWALGESGKTTMKYDTDQAFWSGKTLQKEYYDIGQRTRHERVMEGIDTGKLGVEQYNAETNRLDAQGKYPWLFANGRPVGAGQAGGWTYGGNATTQAEHIDPVQEANLHKEGLRQEAIHSMWSPTGIMSILSHVPDSVASSEEVLTFSREMQKALNGGKMSQDTATREAYNKMTNFLFQQTGVYIKSPEDANKAMLAYTDKYINDNTLNGGMGKAEKEQLRRSYTTIKSNIDAYQKDDLQRETAIEQLARDPAWAKAHKSVMLGNQIMNADDLAKNLPQVFHVIDDTGKPVELPAKTITSALLNGDVKWRGGELRGGLEVNGARYTLPSRIGQGNFGRHNPEEVAFQSVLGNYFGSVSQGSSNKALRDKYISAMGDVVKNTDLYKKNTGLMGPQIVVDHTNPNAPLTQALIEDVLPGQFNEMYDRTEGKNDKFLGGTEKAAVQEALNDPDVTQYIGKSHVFYPKSFTGKPGVEITFGNLADSDKKKIPDNIKALSGKKIFIEQSDTHGATYNKMYPSAPDYSNDPLVKGKTESSDPLLNTMNHCNYKLIPSQGMVTVAGEIKTMDPYSGKEATKKLWIPIPLTDEDPDKIRQVVAQKTAAYGTEYDNNLEYYNHHQHK